MKTQEKDYAIEFDETVKSYNQWLASKEKPEDNEAKRKQRRKAFLRGMSSVRDFYGMGFSLNPDSKRINLVLGVMDEINDSIHPLYDRADLAPEQMDAIALASDWQRVGNSLEKVIAGEITDFEISKDDAKKIKPQIEMMYDHYRKVYVSYAKKANNFSVANNVQQMNSFKNS
jgi:hypothetical protein